MADNIQGAVQEIQVLHYKKLPRKAGQKWNSIPRLLWKPHSWEFTGLAKQSHSWSDLVLALVLLWAGGWSWCPLKDPSNWYFYDSLKLLNLFWTLIKLLHLQHTVLKQFIASKMHAWPVSLSNFICQFLFLTGQKTIVIRFAFSGKNPEL